MKKHFLLILCTLICLLTSALALSGCGLTNWLNGVDIAKETTIHEETESREKFEYDEDDNLNDDDEEDGEKDEDDKQDDEGAEEKGTDER